VTDNSLLDCGESQYSTVLHSTVQYSTVLYCTQVSH